MLPGASADPMALQVRLERLERQLARGTAPEPAPAAQPRAPQRPHAPASATPEPARPPAPKPAEPPAAQQPPPQNEPWPELASPGGAVPRPAPAAAPIAAPAGSTVPAAGDVSLETIVPAWPDLLGAIAAGRAPGFRTAGALLAQGQPVAVRGTELVLAFTPGNASNFQKSGTADTLLREALSDRFGGSWKVTVVQKSPASGAVDIPPDASPRRSSGPSEPSDLEPESEVDLVGDGERAKRQDPVAVAMEALGAQIVDERETS
jgi:DNA polymerase III subunit gamma/tau